MDDQLAAARRELLQNPRDFQSWQNYRRRALRSHVSRPEDLDPRSLFIPRRSEEEWSTAISGWRRRTQIPGRQSGELLSASLSWDGGYLAWICRLDENRTILKVVDVSTGRLLCEDRRSPWVELCFYGPELMIFGSERCGHWSGASPRSLTELKSLGRVRLVEVDAEGWILHDLDQERLFRWPGGERLASISEDRRPLMSIAGRSWLTVAYQAEVRLECEVSLEGGPKAGRRKGRILAWDASRLRAQVCFKGRGNTPTERQRFAIVSLQTEKVQAANEAADEDLPSADYRHSSFSHDGTSLRTFSDGVPRRYDLGGGFARASGIGRSGSPAPATTSWRESAWHPFADVVSFRDSRSSTVQLRSAEGRKLFSKRGLEGVHFASTGTAAMLVISTRAAGSYRLEVWGEV